MLGVLGHLDDCNYNHYNLQLSIYAYIIKRHNPKLKIGSLKIQHVEFEVDGEDKYGYPINTKVGDDFVVKNTTSYEMKYLKNEVNAIVNWLKNNK